MGRFARALLLLLAGLLLVSCGEESPTAPTLPNISISVPTTIIVGGVPTASPSPGDGGALPTGSTVRVGVFGATCPAGVAPPNNGAREMKLPCTAHLTATPKGPDGQDLSLAVHGPAITWSAPFGTATVQCLAPSQPFNRDCKASTIGTFHIEATVKGVTGGLDVTVVP